MTKEFEKLRELLKTKPRSEEAMKDAAEMKQYIQEHSKCFNCGVDCNWLSSDPRYNGVCKNCGSVYSRMITTKNKFIAREHVGRLALCRYRGWVQLMKYLPVPLRGSGTREELLEALDAYIEVME